VTAGTAVLIVNPHASRVTPEVVAAVERELRPAEMLLTEGPGHATELAARACEQADRIYVLSGDGGFNEAVNGIDEDVEVGFLPGGGTSVLPRALGQPHDPVEAARALARSPRVRRISLGRVVTRLSDTVSLSREGGRRFTFAAGLGLDAELVRAVDALGRRADGGRPGDVAFARELLRLVGRRRGRFRPALTVLGRGRAAFALVANGDPYTYVGRRPLRVAPGARFELGLDLVAPKDVRLLDLPRLAWWTLVRPGQTRSSDVIAMHDADSIEVECDGPTALQVDGEDLGDVTEARFEAERDALRVVTSGIDSA
jgi:diacylglycerol kinase family enzyme